MPVNTSKSNTGYKYSARIHGKLGPQVSLAKGVSFWRYNQCVGHRIRCEGEMKYWEAIRDQNPANFDAKAYRKCRDGARRWLIKGDNAEMEIDKINGKVPVHPEVKKAQRRVQHCKNMCVEVKANVVQMEQWKISDQNKFDAKKNRNLKTQLNSWVKKLAEAEENLAIITEEKQKFCLREALTDTSQNYLFKKYFDNPNFDCGINLKMVEATAILNGMEGEDLDRYIYEEANTEHDLQQEWKDEDLQAEENARIEREEAEEANRKYTEEGDEIEDEEVEPVYKVNPPLPDIPDDDEERQVTEWWYYTFGSGYSKPLVGYLASRTENNWVLGNHTVEYFLPRAEVEEDRTMTYAQWRAYMPVMDRLARNVTVAQRIDYVEPVTVSNYEDDVLDEVEEMVIEIEEVKVEEEPLHPKNVGIKLTKNVKNTIGDVLTKVLQKKLGKRLTDEQVDGAHKFFSELFIKMDTMINKEVDDIINGKYLDAIKPITATDISIADEEEELVFTFGMDTALPDVMPYVEKPKIRGIVKTVDLDCPKGHKLNDQLMTIKKLSAVDQIMAIKYSVPELSTSHQQIISDEEPCNDKEETYGDKEEPCNDKEEPCNDKEETYDDMEETYDNKNETYDDKEETYDNKNETYAYEEEIYDSKNEIYDDEEGTGDSKNETYDDEEGNGDNKNETYDDEEGNGDNRNETYDYEEENSDSKNETYDDDEENGDNETYDDEEENPDSEGESYDSETETSDYIDKSIEKQVKKKRICIPWVNNFNGAMRSCEGKSTSMLCRPPTISQPDICVDQTWNWFSAK